MQMHNTTIGIIKDLLKVFQDGREQLVEAANKNGNDIVLCWRKTGLAVYVPEGQPATPEFARIVSVTKATAFVANTTGTDFAFPIIMNGFREVAVPVKRSIVCAEQIKKIDETIAETEERLKEVEAEQLQAMRADLDAKSKPH